jgi:RNA-binding motif X-linked protein 2
MNLDMPRDKQTGKTRGFAFLQYEDQRSTVLAVDNLNGSKILGRVLRVDHAQKPKPKKDEDGNLPDEPSMNAAPPLLGKNISRFHTINWCNYGTFATHTCHLTLLLS